VILSSHLLADVEDVCDRVVIYYGGKIQAMGTLKELLAQPDSVRITTPTLPRATMERVLEIIRGDVATDKVQVDNPTQNLESYFLGVVEKAKQNSAETSGATSGARVAAYLRGDGDAKPSTEKILERFTAPVDATEAPDVRVVTPSPAETAAAKKLAALTKPTEPVEEKKAPVAEPAKPADLSKANEKLSSLLGKPKSDS
jgi:ABC-2 type transport system ATP-binding protein